MATDIAERPGIEEQYQAAGNASDLTVEAERRGAGDVLISAGMSGQFQEDDRQQTYYARCIGMALLRLHGEWDGAPKPKRPTKETIEVLAATIRAEDARDRDKRMKANGELARLQAIQAKEPDFDRAVEIMEQKRLYASGALPLPEVKRGDAQIRASQQAQAWYVNELRLLANSLKSRPALWDQLGLWATFKGIDPEIVAAALLHWLAPTCPACDGHGVKKVPGQPALSARRCENDRCIGGTLKPPRGSRPVLDYLDECLQKARSALKVRLRPR